jgi:two-component system, OmpR family, alkaline phosphatase synthesis response regulator PhoP
MYRILLVEDEEHLQEIIKLNLELENYDVTLAKNGRSALENFRGARFDLCILDLMLPEIDGLTVLRTIRLENNKTPVLILTARNNGAERVEGLKAGADDYLGKPFNLEELLLRINKLISRKDSNIISKSDINEFKFGKNIVFYTKYTILTKDNEEKEISKKEMMLLRLLIDRRNTVVSREEILETVWGYDIFPSTRTIDNFILLFRKYFEQDPKNPIYFFSVRGVGYKFNY